MRSHPRSADRPDPTGATPAGRRRARVLVPGIVGSALLLAACSSPTSAPTTTTTRPFTTTSTTAAATTSTTGAATTTTTTTTATSTSCATSNLTITLGSPNGTAGAVHYGITFRNTAPSTCTLYGYPGVSFLTAGGTQIGAPAERAGTPNLATVALTPGGNAYASVAVTDPGIPPCATSVSATQVRIYPPGETHSVLVATPSGGIAVCGSPNTTAYRSAIVTPVSATAS